MFARASRQLRAQDLKIGVAGNTSVLTEHAVARAGLGADMTASSGRWKISKPDPAFFQALADACGAPLADIAYVGDRIDNDIRPAAALGMTAVHVRRGFWHEAVGDCPLPGGRTAAIDSLAGLPAVLAGFIDTA